MVSLWQRPSSSGRVYELRVLWMTKERVNVSDRENASVFFVKAPACI